MDLNQGSRLCRAGNWQLIGLLRDRFNPFRVGYLVGWDGPRVVSLERNNPGLDDGTPLAFTAGASRRAGAHHAHATAIASRRAMAPAARTPIDPSPPSDSTPPANAAARRHNPNGIESSSPGLPAAGYPGDPPTTRLNPERVESSSERRAYSHHHRRDSPTRPRRADVMQLRWG